MKKVKPPRLPKINLKHLRMFTIDVTLYSESEYPKVRESYDMSKDEIFLPLMLMNQSADRRIKILTKTGKVTFMSRYTWHAHTIQL